MLCKDIMHILEKSFPTEYALEWDNVGLLVGRDTKEVKKIYIALDATEPVIKAAIDQKADMLITHHPMLFSGIKRVTEENLVGRKVLMLASYDISYYAMHTNYDVKGMADLSMEKMGVASGDVLDVTVVEDGKEEGVGRVFDLPEGTTLSECCKMVKEAFDLDAVRLFGKPETIVHRLAICPGAGKSDIENALKKGADVYVTGDIGHHDGLDALEEGLAIIDAGHYGVEHIFIEDIKNYLEKALEGEDVKVVGAPIEHPFVTL